MRRRRKNGACACAERRGGAALETRPSHACACVKAGWTRRKRTLRLCIRTVTNFSFETPLAVAAAGDGGGADMTFERSRGSGV